MADLTNFGENAAVDALVGTGTFYVSLHTADPGETGASNELAAANGYGREAVTFAVSGDTASSVADVEFGPATTDQGTVTHFGVWDAATAGNCLFKSSLSASTAWPSGTLTITAGNLTLTLA